MLADLVSPFEEVPAAILEADTDGTFANGNRAWRDFAGDVTLDSALHPDDRDGAALSIRTGLMIGTEFSLDVSLRSSSGEYFRHALRFAPHKSAGYVVVTTDIDAIVNRSERGSGSSASAEPVPADLVDFRNQITGIIGHDLRNPLSTLVMGTALLRSRLKTDAEQKLVDRLVKASDRLTRMIAQLVDYTSVRLGGTLEISREPGDLSAIVRHVVDDLSRSRSAAIALDTPETISGEWDTARVEQVVTNLVLNAILHGASPVEVTVHANDASASIDVKDHGPRIPNDVLTQLFSPARKRLSPTREAGSLGLGLFITERILQALGGRIEACSTEDGTTFRVELPRTSSPHEPSLP